MACESLIDRCLEDFSTISCSSCEEAEKIRCMALEKLRWATCQCQTVPVQVGTVRFSSPSELIRTLRMIIELTYDICNREEEMEPVMETIWQDACRIYPARCSATSTCSCPQDPEDKYHYQDYDAS